MHIFRISFHNQGKIYELYAETVRQAELFGFIEVAGLVFGENSSVVVDPGEEKLKAEFAGVTRTLVPMQAVVRIDEVEKRGQSKIFELDKNANISYFPSPMFTPPRREK